MLDGQLRKWIDPPLNYLGRQIAATGLTANSVTFGGLVIGLFAAVLVIMGNFQAALWMMLLSRVFDGLDGGRRPRHAKDRLWRLFRHHR